MQEKQKMTYWHMQLYPAELSWNKEVELLESKKLIGLGVSDYSEERFKNEMQIGDIVLIKRGALALALVKVVGKLEDIGENSDDLAWFRWRRKVEILEISKDPKRDFPMPRQTLRKALNPYTLTYKYIDNWYKKIQHKADGVKYQENFKIKALYIERYKILEDFHIAFTDDNNKVLPIMVIAGKNGLGKTSILEYIIEGHLNSFYPFMPDQHNKSYIEVIVNENVILVNNKTINKKLMDSFEKAKTIEAPTEFNGLFRDNFKDHIIYISADIPTKEENGDLNKLILDYVDYFIYTRGENAFTGYENLQNDINEIFEGFELGFQFKKIDSKDRQARFENYHDDGEEREFGLTDLSTGEKTLLFKVLKLYLADTKNKVILIDEPELSLHPSWQNKILGLYETFANVNNCQIILATHSPHIIASAKNEYLRLLKRNDNGKIEVVSDPKAHGRDINSVLFDAMSEVEYRPSEFRDKIDKLYYEIEEQGNYKLAKDLLDELTKDYGSHDRVIIEAKMLLEAMEK